MKMAMALRGDDLFLEIRDNGSGLKPSATGKSSSREGVGFAGMRERLFQLKGHLDIDSSPYGLRITVRLNTRRDSPDPKK